MVWIGSSTYNPFENMIRHSELNFGLLPVRRYHVFKVPAFCFMLLWSVVNIYKTNIESIYLFLKQLARIASRVHYCHHTNILFCELHILKLPDFVKLKTPIIMCEANKKLLSNNLLLLFNSLWHNTWNTTQWKLKTGICKNDCDSPI